MPRGRSPEAKFLEGRKKEGGGDGNEGPKRRRWSHFLHREEERFPPVENWEKMGIDGILEEIRRENPSLRIGPLCYVLELNDGSRISHIAIWWDNKNYWHAARGGKERAVYYGPFLTMKYALFEAVVPTGILPGVGGKNVRSSYLARTISFSRDPEAKEGPLPIFPEQRGIISVCFFQYPREGLVIRGTTSEGEQVEIEIGPKDLSSLGTKIRELATRVFG